METIRWGFLATGRIAHTVARDLALLPDHRLVAAGSRRLEAAQAFVAEHAGPDGPARAHGSYEELVADPDVDVVYIASPHSLHLEHARLALEAGKHVLCEKPVTLNLAEAEEMVALARRHDRFLMEAMWTACHPVVREVRERLHTGEFGTARHLRSELGFRVGPTASQRMLDPALGASALLDMGIYPLTMAHLMLGPAEQVTALADLSDRGIDLDVAVIGRHAGGATSTSTASMTSWSDRSAVITTDLGRIVLHGQMHYPTHAEFTPVAPESTNDSSDQGAVVRIEGREPVIGRGYGNELAEVGRCLRAGLRESPWVPHEQTLAIMRLMDTVRGQIGVSYEVDAT